MVTKPNGSNVKDHVDNFKPSPRKILITDDTEIPLGAILDKA